MKKHEVRKHYKDIAFLENRARLKLLKEFQNLAAVYFNNSTLNMISSIYVENNEAREARAAINLVIKDAYKMIRLAGIKTAALSAPSLSVGGQCQNIDLILNIFNLARNNIPTHVAVEYIERAVDVYKANRVAAFFRTINPVYWIADLVKRIAGR